MSELSKNTQTIAFNLGINKSKLELVIGEWQSNDENIIVESKINFLELDDL